MISLDYNSTKSRCCLPLSRECTCGGDGGGGSHHHQKPNHGSRPLQPGEHLLGCVLGHLKTLSAEDLIERRFELNPATPTEALDWSGVRVYQILIAVCV